VEEVAMEAITGVFQKRSEAEDALHHVQEAGIPPDRATLLTPGSADEIARELRSVPTDTTEQPGMGKAIGALAGGGVGIAGGSLLITLVPGIGPISAVGLLGTAILGAAGATAGANVGGKVEDSVSQGLPEDEIFVYEDALRKGLSVVIALAENEHEASRLRELFRNLGAESVDAAREQWWIGLRSAEESRYAQTGRSFSADERFYRMGFEAALHSRMRCREFDQVSAEMDAALEDVKRQHPQADVEEPFTRGYRRGREYYQELCDEGAQAA
jgi:hypothetical protein